MKCNLKIFRVKILSIMFAIFLTACGSGGGGGGSNGGGEEPPPIADTTVPSIFITSPTGLNGYSTRSSTIDLAGFASDDQTLSNVTWLNNQGGSGTATGTTEWSISGIPLQSGDNLVTVIAKASAGNTASDSITVTYNPNLEFLSVPQASPDTIFTNESTSVVFRISIEDNPNLDVSSVKVLKVDSDNNILGTITTLADNGNINNGDDIASDGVFSGKVTFTETTESSIRLKIAADTIEESDSVTAYSEVFSLSVIAHLTDEEFSKALNMPDETQQKYDELKGTYEEEEAKQKTVEWLASQPEIVQAGISESGEGIWYALDSGILGGILLNPEGTKGGRSVYTSKEPLVKQSLNYKSNKGQIVLEKSSEFGILEALSASTGNPTIGNKNGKETKVLPDSSYFQGLKAEIEEFALTADSSYKLMVENKTIERVRAKRVAIELFYALPKEVKIDYLYKYFYKDSIIIKNILIPLSKEYFPEDIAFLFISQEEFHLVANTKQTKDNFIKFIESIN